jgi:enamine deaminase RidA (YjgF/YER057c/UK114 family)
MKMSRKVLQPPGWPRPKGYSNGISVTGRMVFVAGVVGWNEREEFETDDFAGQTRQALENIVAVLKEGDALPEHIARMTWYVGDKNEYLSSLKAIGEVYKDVMGKHYPVMTAVEVAGFVDDGAKLEIEVTAVVP